MAIFRSPGLADEDVMVEVIDAWNQLIENEVTMRPASPFLVLDPGDIPNGLTSNAVKWPGHPLEAENCVGEESAELLSDWGWQGRAELHNEYMEYRIVTALDENGKERPKRFIATTELMEWWQTMAVHDVDSFVQKTSGLSGTQQSIEDLLGMPKSNWQALPIPSRMSIFRRRIVGNGRSQPPQHPINQNAVLFMSHPINGTDDLVFVVHFGAFPYAVGSSGSRRRARIEEIFRNVGRDDLFCRNADPAAANGAYDQAFIQGTDNAPRGRPLAFADPLGMYIRSFTSSDLFHNGQAVPASWTVLSRGAENDMAQRLEFGPPASEPIFLDDVKLGSQPDAPALSGFQLAKRIEVGPVVVVGPERLIEENEFQAISEVPAGTIVCGTAENNRCQQISRFQEEFEASQQLPGGRRGG